MPQTQQEVLEKAIAMFQNEYADPRPTPRGFALRGIFHSLDELIKARPEGINVLEVSETLNQLSLFALTLQNEILRAEHIRVGKPTS